MLGLWVEETDALFPHEHNGMIFQTPVPGFADAYGCGFLCDILHTEGAESLAVYDRDFYAGTPCFTRNAFGEGAAYYIGTEPDANFLRALCARVCEQAGIAPAYCAPEGVEITMRDAENGPVVFILNHNAENAQVELGGEGHKNLLTGDTLSGTVTIAGRDVLLLQKQSAAG